MIWERERGGKKKVLTQRKARSEDKTESYATWPKVCGHPNVAPT